MEKPLRKTHLILKAASGVLYDLPTPPNLTAMWNFGSLLGVTWVVQVGSGLMLACQYTPDVDLAFSSVVYTMRDVHHGWLMRSVHCNGASAFFVAIFFHIGRGMFYHSFLLTGTWLSGCFLLFLLMSVAFSGYVLPWGQMSYWGATVIINLFSALPVVGKNLVEWVWGGYSVGGPTLKRFFVFHFLSPFVLMAVICVHISYLHKSGSSNPLGINSSADSIRFHSVYTLKDTLGVIFYVFLLGVFSLAFPDFFGDPLNFEPANPMKTPTLIQPEWYFLFAYAILRSVPNKLGGVLSLLFSVLVLVLMALYPKGLFKGIQFNPISQALFWSFVSNFFLLSFVGACPIEYPYYQVGVLSSGFYFLFFLVYPLTYLSWDSYLLGAHHYSVSPEVLFQKKSKP